MAHASELQALELLLQGLQPRGGLGLQHLAAVFVGLTLHGIALASIGLACSAFTKSQLVAAVSAWAIAFLLWDFS